MNKRRRFKAKRRRRANRRYAELMELPVLQFHARLSGKAAFTLFNPARVSYRESPDQRVLEGYLARKAPDVVTLLSPCGCPLSAIEGSRCGTCGAEVMGVIRTWTEPRQAD